MLWFGDTISLVGIGAELSLGRACTVSAMLAQSAGVYLFCWKAGAIKGHFNLLYDYEFSRSVSCRTVEHNVHIRHIDKLLERHWAWAWAWAWAL
ncbi:hypothetical protein P8452_42012 [Trifolium repens]|nr:hypothetical protein P8452_42012 [Trifolium repens]